MKRTWIKVKRGLLAPKHREALGIRIWLYMYMLDRADWETGIIYGWRDKDEAEDIGMPWRSLQRHRQKLDKDGYITCELVGDYQNIIIHNWTNPREYSGEVYNEKEGVYAEVSTPENEGGTREGTREGSIKVSTPSLYSHITQQEGEDILDVIDVLQPEWDMWVAYRKEINKTLKPTTVTFQIKKLRNYKPKIAKAMLVQSMENGWVGLFELKSGNGRGQFPPAEKAGKGWTSTESQFSPDDVEDDCKACWCTPCICNRVKPQSEHDDWERVLVFNRALQEKQVYVFLKEEVAT